MKATTILTALAVVMFSISLTAQRAGRAERNLERSEQRQERVLPQFGRGMPGPKMRAMIKKRLEQMRGQFQRGGPQRGPARGISEGGRKRPPMNGRRGMQERSGSRKPGRSRLDRAKRGRGDARGRSDQRRRGPRTDVGRRGIAPVEGRGRPGTRQARGERNDPRSRRGGRAGRRGERRRGAQEEMEPRRKQGASKRRAKKKGAKKLGAKRAAKKKAGAKKAGKQRKDATKKVDLK